MVVLLLKRMLPFLFLPSIVWAQSNNGFVKGRVTEKTESGNTEVLIGANVYWMGTTKGVATDNEGEFAIERIKGTSKLIISYVGYVSDTIDVANKSVVEVALHQEKTLDEVEISYRQNSTTIDYSKVDKTETMGEKHGNMGGS